MGEKKIRGGIKGGNRSSLAHKHRRREGTFGKTRGGGPLRPREPTIKGTIFRYIKKQKGKRADRKKAKNV